MHEKDGNDQVSPKNRYSFFTEKAWYAYTNAPINFSTLTGWRYPGIPRLKGNLVAGRLSHTLAEDGIKANLMAAGNLAINHPSGMCYFWMGHKLSILITNPRHIEQVLVANHKNISKISATRIMDFFVGQTIISDSKEMWVKKRAIYKNALYTHEALCKSEVHMKCIANEILTELYNSHETDIDLNTLFNSFTVKILIKSLVGRALASSEEAINILKHVAELGVRVANFKNFFYFALPERVRHLFLNDKSSDPELIKRNLRKSFEALLLAPNLITIKEKENFLYSIWQLNTEDSLKSSNMVYSEGSAFLFAAQDTTVGTFQFIVKLLHEHPEVEKKLRKELNKYLCQNDLAMEQIDKIEYLEMVINEAMRLYPVSPVILPRDVENAFELDGIPLSKGDMILISPYFTHRLSNIWENAEKFIPERFSEENKKRMGHYSYIPFSAGPHQCIGRRFAMQQLKMLIAAIYMHYHIEIENNDFDTKLTEGTLKPTKPTLARFIAVSQSNISEIKNNKTINLLY